MKKFRSEIGAAWVVGCRDLWRVARPLWAFPLIRAADYAERLSPVPVMTWTPAHRGSHGLTVPDDLWLPAGDLRELVDSVIFAAWAGEANRLALNHRLPEMRANYERCWVHLRREAARLAEIEAAEFVRREAAAC